MESNQNPKFPSESFYFTSEARSTISFWKYCWVVMYRFNYSHKMYQKVFCVKGFGQIYGHNRQTDDCYKAQLMLSLSIWPWTKKYGHLINV